MKVIELFAGIGAPRMALKKLNINHEVVCISEILKTSIDMYNKIHRDTLNLGDITKIKELPYCDFLHFSSPCIDFSRAGKQQGVNGKGGSKLIYEVYRLLDNYKERNILPKYLSFENVPDLKTKEKFSIEYNKLINKFKELGYNVYDKILSAQYFNNATCRQRLFVIAIRKDIDNYKFKMPEETRITSLRIKDFLSLPDDKYLWPHPIIFHPLNNNEENIETTRKLGWLETACGHETQSNRVWNKNGLCPAITCAASFIVQKDNNKFYRLSEEELWKIQGFSQEDFNKIKNEFSKSAIIKAIGNSIALGPLEAIYKNLFIE